MNSQHGTLAVTHGKSSAARRVLPMTPRVRVVLEKRWLAAGKPDTGYPSFPLRGRWERPVPPDVWTPSSHSPVGRIVLERDPLLFLCTRVAYRRNLARGRHPRVFNDLVAEAQIRHIPQIPIREAASRTGTHALP